MICLISDQLMRHPLTKLFHLSSLLQMPNDYRIVDAEFFSNFSSSCTWTSFRDSSQSVVVNFDGRPSCSLSSRFSSPLQNFWDHHCTVPSLAVPGSNELLMLQVVSATLPLILNSNKKSLKFAFCLTSFP